MCKCYTVLFIFMPSNRKRIGFLPSEEVHHLIEKICIENNCSQSKVTGILVEEALRARGVYTLQETNDLIKSSSYNNPTYMNNSSFKYSDLDELISDQGITYNTRTNKHKSDNFLSEDKEAYNKDLFEKFKQFILFQKMIEEK